MEGTVMNAFDATRTGLGSESKPSSGFGPSQRCETSYPLESKLARVGLYATRADPDRWLAWANSISILFLLVEIVGSTPATVSIGRPRLLTRSVPPWLNRSRHPRRPSPSHRTQPPQNDQEQPDSHQVVVVTPEAPNITFSVPTVGNLLAPIGLAQAPPVAELRPAVPFGACPRR